MASIGPLYISSCLLAWSGFYCSNKPISNSRDFFFLLALSFVDWMATARIQDVSILWLCHPNVWPSPWSWKKKSVEGPWALCFHSQRLADNSQTAPTLCKRGWKRQSSWVPGKRNVKGVCDLPTVSQTHSLYTKSSLELSIHLHCLGCLGTNSSSPPAHVGSSYSSKSRPSSESLISETSCMKIICSSHPNHMNYSWLPPLLVLHFVYHHSNFIFVYSCLARWLSSITVTPQWSTNKSFVFHFCPGPVHSLCWS